MNFENEITVEVDTTLENLINILESNGFKHIKTCDMRDIYLINKNDKKGSYISMLSKCVLIRDIIDEDNETKVLIYKYKKYNNNKEIVNKGK